MPRATLLLVFCALLACGRPTQAVDFTVRQVADINPGSASTDPMFFHIVDNQLFFLDNRVDSSTRGLYRTDGTKVTRLSQEFIPHPDCLTSFNGELYFAAASQSDEPLLLYRTDGNRIEEFDILLTDGFSFCSGFGEFGGELYFLGQTIGDLVFSLYKTDGDSFSIVGDTLFDPDLVEFTEFRDELYFRAREFTGAFGIYKTDGSGVAIGPDTTGISINSYPIDFTEFSGELYFLAGGTDGLEPYKTDGATVTLVQDINPNGDSIPRDFTVFNDELFFVALQNVSGGPSQPRLFKTDGTSITEFVGISPSNPTISNGLREYGGELYLPAEGPNGLELYATDGTGIAPAGGIPLVLLTEFAGELFFAGLGPDGSELYKTDGVALAQIADLNPGIFHANPGVGFIESGADVLPITDVVTFGGELFFAATGPDGRELYKLTIAGDADEDGHVQFSDFVILANHFSRPGGWTDGDFDLNGTVEFGDFVILANNFGAGTVATGAESVPEPSAFLTALMALVGLLRARRVGCL